MLKGKKILLGITGSIAAYKAILVIRGLVKKGADVKVVMTPSAKDFVSPLTISTLSKNEVLIDIFKEDSWANHVMLGRWADIMLIAPVSCNTIAKMANGLCDNLLLSVYLSATCPVMIAPAMDEDMWLHPATQKNISLLGSYGNIVLPVEKGELASGLVGPGRMAEPDTIITYLEDYFKNRHVLAGKKALVTAGPTYEHIDPVRFIGNHSSGKMGVAIANDLAGRGAEVTLVLGPVNISFNFSSGVKVIRVNSAGEMYDACVNSFEDVNFAVMSAAVADYTPVTAANEKIKKKDENLLLELKKTKDILKSLGEKKREDQVLVGFALETNNEEANARQKMQQKNADMIVLNSLRDKDAGFSKDTNKVTIYFKNGEEKKFDVKSKEAVAKDIVDCIIQYHHA
ncbi:MAG: bifunctional phosphopantothenoylcysteine decarboxylase/phosphopantothenate--cysteine ligase CoaBC [Terrimonas sp.]|nr:bifunctional phosphopantothenoylcysteine decarboxylase/phosphopantothenate--cysteine ligase CoaBC [Terrimonas sp.]OJY99157.1 MAG: phosphopantothenoylcysteine decarboxylase [Sphingobacteriales bacterium 40-81]